MGSTTADAVADTSPEELSTDPVLEWAEVELDLPNGIAPYATSDGRIVAAGSSAASDSFPTTSHLLVTGDGTTWTQMPLPDEMLLLASSIDMSDDLVAISGVPYAEPPAGGDVADIGARVFVSGNQGATWSQAALDIEAARRDLGVDETVEFSLTSVYVSGDDVVAAVQGHTRLDVASLLVDAGRLEADARVAGWASEGGSVRVWLDNRDGSETELRYSHDDLALTDSQKALLRDERDDPLHGGRVFLFSGEGAELSFRASYRGWASTGSAVDDGFRLILFTEEGDSLLISPDGESWSVHPLDRDSSADVLHLDAFAPDGTLWTARFSTTLGGGFGSSIHRQQVGESGTQTAHFPVIEALGGLAVGDAGLVVGGFTALDGSDSATGQSMPDGRLNKDGYELRFNEPEGGITLWDLTAGETVYVFSAEAVQGTTEPPGVRTEGSGDFAMLTFEDPDTGEDLVSFSMVELFEVMGPPPPMAAGVPEQWVGWSRDGVQWGWESAQEAFGLGDMDAVARFAVGEDFAIAMVWLIPPPELSSGADEAGRIPETRWFVARVP
ncbi:hypothetical protein [Candidatus Poriferisodalis sp.]|uniref:hypothetical protein n=1 Tax=Candidatus Poriferisodalis sp. TaxID=3101277 RepID=UPI003B023CB0